jgi:hypothetical protein
MAGLYLDTSALGRVLLGEPDAETIRDALITVWPSRRQSRAESPSLRATCVQAAAFAIATGYRAGVDTEHEPVEDDGTSSIRCLTRGG